MRLAEKIMILLTAVDPVITHSVIPPVTALLHKVWNITTTSQNPRKPTFRRDVARAAPTAATFPRAGADSASG